MRDRANRAGVSIAVPIAERDNRTDTRRRHQPAAHRVVPDDLQDSPVIDLETVQQHVSDLQQAVADLRKGRVASNELADAQLDAPPAGLPPLQAERLSVPRRWFSTLWISPTTRRRADRRTRHSRVFTCTGVNKFTRTAWAMPRSGDHGQGAVPQAVPRLRRRSRRHRAWTALLSNLTGPGSHRRYLDATRELIEG